MFNYGKIHWTFNKWLKSSAVLRSSNCCCGEIHPFGWWNHFSLFRSFANQWMGKCCHTLQPESQNQTYVSAPLTQDCSFHPRLSLVGRFRLVAVLRWPRSLVDGRETNLGWHLCGETLDPKKLTGSWLFKGDSQDVTFVLLFSTVWFTSLWWDQLDPKKFSPNPGNDRAARHWLESRGGSANRNFSHFFGGIPSIERLLFVDDHWSVIRCNKSWDWSLMQRCRDATWERFFEQKEELNRIRLFNLGFFTRPTHFWIGFICELIDNVRICFCHFTNRTAGIGLRSRNELNPERVEWLEAPNLKIHRITRRCNVFPSNHAVRCNG